MTSLMIQGTASGVGKSVLESYARLRRGYDVVIVEGAGSPAEPNLRQGDIAVVAYPRMSNHDDIDPLASEAGVNSRFVHLPEELQAVDLVILPGSR